ncbi:MAG: 50S ribosomal protein L11 methyltransferase [Acidiphilium sp.]
MTARVELLDRVVATVPPDALEAYESAIAAHCLAVSFTLDEARNIWVIEGYAEPGTLTGLDHSLLIAEAITGVAARIERDQVPAGGWLARSYAGFPEQQIGARFAIRGSHISEPPAPGRLTITLDAGLAFGSGEHQSTRGCLLALEQSYRQRRPLHMLDLGTGSGVLAIACATLWHQRLLATDIDARSVRVARENARRNGVGAWLNVIKADGWQSRALKRAAPFDLILANILARPLAAMAGTLATHLAPGGTAILAGLLTVQERWVLTAHRRHGLVLQSRIRSGAWSTLVLRKPDRRQR